LAGLGVDDQFKPRWLLNRKVAWLGALQYLVDIVGGVAIHIVDVRSVREESPCARQSSPPACQRNAIFQRKVHDLPSVQRRMARRHDIQAIAVGLRHGAEYTLEI